jgi:hypothetical protein
MTVTSINRAFRACECRFSGKNVPAVAEKVRRPVDNQTVNGEKSALL